MVALHTALRFTVGQDATAEFLTLFSLLNSSGKVFDAIFDLQSSHRPASIALAASAVSNTVKTVNELLLDVLNYPVIASFSENELFDKVVEVYLRNDLNNAILFPGIGRHRMPSFLRQGRNQINGALFEKMRSDFFKIPRSHVPFDVMMDVVKAGYQQCFMHSECSRGANSVLLGPAAGLFEAFRRTDFRPLSGATDPGVHERGAGTTRQRRKSDPQRSRGLETDAEFKQMVAGGRDVLVPFIYSLFWYVVQKGAPGTKTRAAFFAGVEAGIEALRTTANHWTSGPLLTAADTPESWDHPPDPPRPFRLAAHRFLEQEREKFGQQPRIQQRWTVNERLTHNKVIWPALYCLFPGLLNCSRGLTFSSWVRSKWSRRLLQHVNSRVSLPDASVEQLIDALISTGLEFVRCGGSSPPNGGVPKSGRAVPMTEPSTHPDSRSGSVLNPGTIRDRTSHSISFGKVVAALLHVRDRPDAEQKTHPLFSRAFLKHSLVSIIHWFFAKKKEFLTRYIYLQQFKKDVEVVRKHLLSDQGGFRSLWVASPKETEAWQTLATAHASTATQQQDSGSVAARARWITLTLWARLYRIDPASANADYFWSEDSKFPLPNEQVWENREKSLDLEQVSADVWSGWSRLYLRRFQTEFPGVDLSTTATTSETGPRLPAAAPQKKTPVRPEPYPWSKKLEPSTIETKLGDLTTLTKFWAPRETSGFQKRMKIVNGRLKHRDRVRVPLVRMLVEHWSCSSIKTIENTLLSALDGIKQSRKSDRLLSSEGVDQLKEAIAVATQVLLLCPINNLAAVTEFSVNNVERFDPLRAARPPRHPQPGNPDGPSGETKEGWSGQRKEKTWNSLAVVVETKQDDSQTFVTFRTEEVVVAARRARQDVTVDRFGFLQPRLHPKLAKHLVDMWPQVQASNQNIERHRHNLSRFVALHGVWYPLFRRSGQIKPPSVASAVYWTSKDVEHDMRLRKSFRVWESQTMPHVEAREWKTVLGEYPWSEEKKRLMQCARSSAVFGEPVLPVRSRVESAEMGMRVAEAFADVCKVLDGPVFARYCESDPFTAPGKRYPVFRL